MVNVTAAEPGAAVAVDGAPVGTTPLAAPIPLDLGTHTLTVRKEGFDPFEKSVEIAGGGLVAITAALVASFRGAHLTVSADSSAAVRVDDALSANGRFDGPLAPGTHTVRVTESGKVPYAASVDLHAGETRTLDVTLENQRRAPLWPWIASGAAVVIAGAVVGGYFLFKPSNAPGESAAPPAGALGTVNFH